MRRGRNRRKKIGDRKESHEKSRNWSKKIGEGSIIKLKIKKDRQKRSKDQREVSLRKK